MTKIERIRPVEMKRRRAELRDRRTAEQQDCLRWLVDFVETQPADIRKPTLVERLQGDLARFEHVLVAEMINEPAGRSPADIPIGDIVRIHSEVQQLFETLWPTHQGDAPQPYAPLAMSDCSVLLTIVAATGQVARIMTARWPASFWWTTIGLLERWGFLVRRCRARRGDGVCGRLFVRERRQLFCSRECARRDAARQWYDAHRGEAQRRRRARYRRQNSNAKIHKKKP